MCLSISFFLVFFFSSECSLKTAASVVTSPVSASLRLFSTYIYIYISLSPHLSEPTRAGVLSAAAALIRWILFGSLQGMSWMCPPGGFRNQ